MLEDQGFRLLGAHEVAPEILMPEGPLGAKRPSARDEADIARGIEVLRAIGPFDIGQAVVVADNHVLALEAAEGTDQMLARIVELQAEAAVSAPATGVGVLVKAPKPDQDRRFDLPSIGPRTIEGVQRAGLAGLAVLAGGTIVAEPRAHCRSRRSVGHFRRRLRRWRVRHEGLSRRGRGIRRPAWRRADAVAESDASAARSNFAASAATRWRRKACRRCFGSTISPSSASPAIPQRLADDHQAHPPDRARRASRRGRT